MAYNPPGVRVNQETVTTSVVAQESELPTCIIGPLYQIFLNSVTEDSFDSLLDSAQVFGWPEIVGGSVVDLDGIRGGLIDSQRKELAKFVPEFSLLDRVTKSVTELADSDISAISQDGFSVTRPDGLIRATISCGVVNLNGEIFLYSPDGGFSTSVKVGDVFLDGSDQNTVLRMTSTTLFVEDSDDLTEDSVTKRGGGAQTVDGSASATPGRTTFEISGGTFAAIGVGDIAITGKGIAGLTGFSGNVDDADDHTVVDLTFSTTLDLADYIAKIDGAVTTFSRISSFDQDAGTITFDDDIGTLSEAVTITIYKSQLGYVESKSIDNTTAEIVTPSVVSEADTFVWFVDNSASEFDFYPEFDLRVTFRALRYDLANEVHVASSLTELEETLGFSVHESGELSFAVKTCILAQPIQNNVYFIPVDLYQNDRTGLTEDQDEESGYSDALEVAETIDVYNIIALSNDNAINSLVISHVNSQSTAEEAHERRAFVSVDVVLGEFESNTGYLTPGRTRDGIVDEFIGNKVLYDESMNFVTEAGVTAGTKVVITFPDYYAGTYIATDDTTDTELHLEGDDWNILDEFASLFSEDYDVTTSANLHTLEPVGASPAVAPFTHAEVGDYVNLVLDGVEYRMKIVAIAANKMSCTLEDEVGGNLSFTSEAATEIFIVRSWINPAVKYYINPLTKVDQVTETVAKIPASSRRVTALINQSPTIEGVEYYPQLTAVAVAAKRSGSEANQEVTNLFLGANIDEVKYGFGHFNRSQLNSLAENGFTLISQSSRTANPLIRDMVTTKTGSGLVDSEEVVTSNADWQAKTLRSTFTIPPGARLPQMTPRLLGIRTMAIDALFRKWLDDGRLVDYTITKVEQNSTNQRKLDISYSGKFPVAEKEIEFNMTLTV